MKRFHRKFRIMLLTLALGLACVPFFRMIHERWTAVRINIPQVESNAPLIVSPYEITKDSTIKQDRDLSLYEFGGNYSECFDNENSKFQECEANLKKARAFVWQHWNAKKRSYIVIEHQGCCSADGKNHIFIEPDEKRQWHIVIRRVNKTYAWGNWIDNMDIESLEFIRDYDDGKRRLCFSYGEHGQWCL